MSYSMSVLETAADCDALLLLVGKEKDDLEFRKTSLERQEVTFAESSVNVPNELEGVNVELTSLLTATAGMQDGDAKSDLLKRIKKLEYQQMVLQERAENYSKFVLIDKQFDIQKMIKQVEAADALITAIQTRKAELPPTV